MQNNRFYNSLTKRALRAVAAVIASAASLMPAVASAQTYNVMDYGAVADTTQLSTQAIQHAIDDCSAHGGGTVSVPAGNYLCTTVMLKDNVNLRLEAGATIYASRKISDYAGLGHKVGAADTEAAYMLVGALNVKNISLTGLGTLNGRAVREGFRRKPQTAVTDSVTGREIANAIRYGVDYQSKWRKVAPYTGAVNFTGCTNVHISGVQVVESNFWSVHLQWCDRVYVDGVYIMSSSYNGVNADGLDIDGCQNVMISNSKIDTGDDALCLKTTNKEGQTRPCRDVCVTNCVLRSSSAALKIGTESHADFENITVTNCVIDGANRGLNMIIRDGAHVKNLLFSDLVINTVRKQTFWWGNGDPLWFTVQIRKPALQAGSIENVSLRNIIAHGQSGVRMEGFDGDISNISIEGFQLFMEPEDAADKRARNAFMFDRVKDLRMRDCSVTWNTQKPESEWQSAYSFNNVDGLEMVRVKGSQAPNKRFSAFRYSNVSNATIDGKQVKTNK